MKWRSHIADRPRMKTFHNHLHHVHQGRQEMFRGQMVPCFEVPARLDQVLARVRKQALGPVLEAPPRDPQALAAVHSPAYLQFLAGAWAEWVAMDPANAGRDALPSVWPNQGLRSDVLPGNFAARLGRHAFDSGSPLTAGTWQAACQGAWCALAAADTVATGDRAAFALSRPPGHHAGADFFGGYCFLNNAALAADALRRHGCARVAVLDIDYHHGNGTQAIFYDRSDVFFASIHGDPHTEYPFFLGYLDELGTGPGEGFNLNLPLPRGTGYVRWREALQLALQRIAAFDADALVVSLGLDTFEGDPISGFRLASTDYPQVGEDLARAGLPTVFVFEGGYAVDALAVNAVNVLEGFAQKAG
jgi:acetoin utilization deacetylase AcuC-like enzyme